MLFKRTSCSVATILRKQSQNDSKKRFFLGGCSGPWVQAPTSVMENRVGSIRSWVGVCVSILPCMLRSTTRRMKIQRGGEKSREGRDGTYILVCGKLLTLVAGGSSSGTRSVRSRRHSCAHPRRSRRRTRRAPPPLHPLVSTSARTAAGRGESIPVGGRSGGAAGLGCARWIWEFWFLRNPKPIDVVYVLGSRHFGALDVLDGSDGRSVCSSLGGSHWLTEVINFHN